MNNVEVRKRPRFIAIAKSLHTIVAGAVGWIDTDLSGDIPVGAIAVMVSGYPGAIQAWGVRSHDDAVDTSADGHGVTWDFRITGVDSNRHIDLYRAGSDNTYYVIGYVI